jgi:hypothetical protein
LRRSYDSLRLPHEESKTRRPDGGTLAGVS